MSKELLFDPNAIREALKRQREKHTKEVCQKVGPKICRIGQKINHPQDLTASEMTMTTMKIRECPCCGREPFPTDLTQRGFTIKCPKGCFEAFSNDLRDVISIWNSKRFTDK